MTQFELKVPTGLPNTFYPSDLIGQVARFVIDEGPPHLEDTIASAILSVHVQCDKQNEVWKVTLGFAGAYIWRDYELLYATNFGQRHYWVLHLRRLQGFGRFFRNERQLNATLQLEQALQTPYRLQAA